MSGEWSISGVSVAGRSHLAAGTPCEDAHFMHEDEECVVLVACDGKGSGAKYAHLGAAAVSRVVGRLLATHCEEVFAGKLRPQTVLDAALSCLENLAARKRTDVREFACTLVALVARDGQEVATFHIGDGAAYLLDAEVPVCISRPDGEGNATYFVTTRDTPLRHFRRKIPRRVTGLVVTTDGASALYNSATNEVHPLVTHLANRADFGPGNSMLEDCVRRTLVPVSDDDITVVVARRSFTSGIYGCPTCGGQNIGAFLSASKTAFRVRCRGCKESALHVTLRDFPEARQRFQRNLRRAGFTRTMIAQRVSTRR